MNPSKSPTPPHHPISNKFHLKVSRCTKHFGVLISHRKSKQKNLVDTIRMVDIPWLMAILV